VIFEFLSFAFEFEFEKAKIKNLNLSLKCVKGIKAKMDRIV